ncbi:hypothetical protein HPB51_007860 [Rhipicephalus microplus]|uniref:CHHC U11-48K-type domain-containing protein n=1 Tax=Rhipicephalus microplus TaxID=6941 RepID=A0A9J6EMF3_RHIMP|nr:hypothetical protein HPB51_007860 [Rhipicephalus microplus]
MWQEPPLLTVKIAAALCSTFDAVTSIQPRFSTMATFQSAQDDLVVCPYNEHHKVKKGRLDIHKSKCQQGDRRRRVLPHCFTCDHDAPAEVDANCHQLETCPNRTRNLTSTAAREEPPYDLPAPGGGRVFF